MQTAEIKGWRNGLLATVPAEGAWEAAVTSLEARLDEAKANAFWRGSPIVLDFGTRAVSPEALSALVNRLKEEYGLIPTTAVSADAGTRSAAEKLVLTAYETLPVIQKAARDIGAESASVAPAPPGNNALYLPGTVRAGQRVVHDGHLIIGGNVNSGSEVAAGGDILVFGTLRGVAHAGCFGDESARILALSLRPPQLRIATKIARAPEESHRDNRAAAPEVARIENGEIQIFPL